MGTTAVFYPHGLYATGTLTLTQLRNVAPMHNFEDLVELAAGQVGPQFTGTHQAQPGITFGTDQLKDLLDAMASGRHNAVLDLSAGNVDLELKAGEQLNDREADADELHIRARMEENAMLALESITARQGGTAVANLRLMCIYNATTGNDPLVFTNNVALTITSDIEHLFTLGPVKINGSFVEGVEEMTLDNRNEYEVVFDSGLGFPSYIALKTYKPQLRFTTRNSRAMATYGTKGTAVSALSWWWRKKLRSNINVLDATAEHIGYTATKGTIKPRGLGDNMSPEITIDLEMPSQNSAAYTIDTTSAIA
jgi:hypothetical protein